MLLNSFFADSKIITNQPQYNFSIATIGIVSKNTALFNGEQYLEMKDLLLIEQTFGTNSQEYIAAKKALSQSIFDIKNQSEYRFIFIPFDGLAGATRGYTITPDLTANLANFKSGSDFDFAISIDGKPNITVEIPSFKKAKTIEDIANQLNDLEVLHDVDVQVVDGTKIKFTSLNEGLDSSILIQAVTGSTKTNLTAAGYLNIAAATKVDGINATLDVASLISKLETVNQETEFSLFVILETLDIDKAVALHNAIIANEYLSKRVCFIHTAANVADTTKIKEEIRTVSNVYTPLVLQFQDFYAAIHERDVASFNLTLACAMACNDVCKPNNPVITLHSKQIDGMDINRTKVNAAEAILAESNGTPTYGVYPNFGDRMRQAKGVWSPSQKVSILNIQGTCLNAIRKRQNQGIEAIMESDAEGIILAVLRPIFDICKNNKTFGVLKDESILAGASSATYGNKKTLVQALKTDGFYIYVAPVQNNTAYVYIHMILGEEIYQIMIPLNLYKN